MRLNRRRFAKRTAEAALAMTSFGVLGTAARELAEAESPEEKLLPIVDTHQRHILPGSKEGEGLWSRKEFRAGIRLLGELGMCFDLCMPAERLPEAIGLVDACPDTRFVLDHCGNADPKQFTPPGNRDAANQARAEQWRRDVARLAEREQVICKISGIVARAPKESWTAADLAPVIHHCLEVFGPDRVVFASDWPVCTRVATLGQWLEALKAIIRQRPETDRRKLLHDNAVRFYGLA